MTHDHTSHPINVNFDGRTAFEIRTIIEENVAALILHAYLPDIKAIYLIGSQADGSFTPSSDMDFVVIGGDNIDRASFQFFSHSLARVSAVPLDLKLFCYSRLAEGLESVDPCILHKSRLIYGDDCMNILVAPAAAYVSDNISKLTKFFADFQGTRSELRAHRLAYLCVARVCRLAVFEVTGSWPVTKSQSLGDFTRLFPELSECPNTIKDIGIASPNFLDIEDIRQMVADFIRKCCEIFPPIRAGFPHF